MAGADVTITGGDGASNQSYPSASPGHRSCGCTTIRHDLHWGALRYAAPTASSTLRSALRDQRRGTRATVMGNVLSWLEGA